METSGVSNWISPPGFQEAAVASSATPMKAPPMPRARAPEPTGLGDEEISIVWVKVAAQAEGANRTNEITKTDNSRIQGPSSSFAQQIAINN
jgi:hypothetical protein